MLNHFISRCGAALVVLIGAACARNPEASDRSRYAHSMIAPPAEPVAIGGGPRNVPVENATDDIAAARCEREARCGNVGADKKFVDKRDCLETLAKRIVDELGTDHCPDGIHGGSLAECVREARGESCEESGAARLCSPANVCRSWNDTAAMR